MTRLHRLTLTDNDPSTLEYTCSYCKMDFMFMRGSTNDIEGLGAPKLLWGNENNQCFGEPVSSQREQQAVESLTYEDIIDLANTSPDFRLGLLAAAEVCKANSPKGSWPPCPSDMAAVYITNLANGEKP